MRFLNKLTIILATITFINILTHTTEAQQPCRFKDGSMMSTSRYRLEEAQRLIERGNVGEIQKMVNRREIVFTDRSDRGVILEQLPKVVKVRIEGINHDVWVFRRAIEP